MDAEDSSATASTSPMLVLHAGRAGGDLLRGGRDLLDPGGHVLDGLADRQERLACLLDHGRAVGGALGAVLDDANGLGGLVLDRADQLRDLVRGVLGLLGELAHLIGHDREPAALLARAGGLDRGVQREQVGLLGDPGDRRDDRADLLGLGSQLADRLGHRLA